MTRFLHTADWQLGMTRHFFSEGVQERYSQARFDAIRQLGQAANQEDCDFVVVCGDTFESNQVDRKTIARACEALNSIPVPVYLLPGNHDPLNVASVYRTNTFIDHCPDNVTVIDDTSPRSAATGVEIIGAPWTSKKPAINPLEDVLKRLTPTSSKTRVVLGHGILDRYTPKLDAPALINAASLEKALREGRADFIALGDRHSITSLDPEDRAWYSGSPESTDFREEKSGFALLVELGERHVSTRELPIGQWRFVEKVGVVVNNDGDVANLNESLDAIDNKARTVVRLRLSGGLTVTQYADLNRHLQAAEDLFAGFDVRTDDLSMVPEDADFSSLGFSGFADKTVAKLRTRIEAGGEQSESARDALMLLFRLAEGSE